MCLVFIADCPSIVMDVYHNRLYESQTCCEAGTESHGSQVDSRVANHKGNAAVCVHGKQASI